MKFELDPESSEHSFWELDQFEHDSSHPDGAFCVPVLHSEREWQVCLLLYFCLYSVVVLCTDARFQTAWNGMLHQGLVHIQLWSNFNVFQMCLVIGGCSSAVRRLWRSQHGCRTLRDASNWPILNTYSITQKLSLTQSHAFPWIHQVRRAIHLKFIAFPLNHAPTCHFWSATQPISKLTTRSIKQAIQQMIQSIKRHLLQSAFLYLQVSYLADFHMPSIRLFWLTSLRRPAAPGSAPDCVAQKRWEWFPTHSNKTNHNKQCRTDVYTYMYIYIYAV